MCVAFYMEGWRGTAATTTIFIAASITDWLDGYLARKVTTYYYYTLLSNSTFLIVILQLMQMKLKSSFGAFLDPVADKVFLVFPLHLTHIFTWRIWVSFFVSNFVICVQLKFFSECKIIYVECSLWLLLHWSYCALDLWMLVCLDKHRGYSQYLQLPSLEER